MHQSLPLLPAALALLMSINWLGCSSDPGGVPGDSSGPAQNASLSAAELGDEATHPSLEAGEVATEPTFSPDAFAGLDVDSVVKAMVRARARAWRPLGRRQLQEWQGLSELEPRVWVRGQALRYQQAMHAGELEEACAVVAEVLAVQRFKYAGDWLLEAALCRAVDGRLQEIVPLIEASSRDSSAFLGGAAGRKFRVLELHLLACLGEPGSSRLRSLRAVARGIGLDGLVPLPDLLPWTLAGVSGVESPPVVRRGGSTRDCLAGGVELADATHIRAWVENRCKEEVRFMTPSNTLFETLGYRDSAGLQEEIPVGQQPSTREWRLNPGERASDAVSVGVPLRPPVAVEAVLFYVGRVDVVLR